MTKIHRLSLFFLIPLIISLSACAPSAQQTPPWNAQIQTQSATQRPETLESQTPKEEEQPQMSFSGLPPVKVGILLPLSGQNAKIGQAMLQAAQLAVFDMGYDSFELIPRDTQGTAQGAMVAANAAITDGAQIILGPLFADAVRSAKTVAAKNNINVIAFSTDWGLAGNNTYVMGFLPFAQVQRVTRYAAANGIRDMGVIAPADRYGDTVLRSFQDNAKASAIHISRLQRFDPRDKNVAPKLQPFANPPVEFEAIFMPVGGTQAQVISNALGYYNLPAAQYRRIGTGLLDDPNLTRDASMQGAWFAAPSPRSRHGFETRYKNTYGQTPPRVATLAYDATALAAVLAATGYKTTGAPAFDRNSLLNPNGFAGIDGIFRFGKNGLVERGLAVLEIRNGRIIEIDPAPKTFEKTVY